jgi:pimeloyl-ACP methyl ester carboxylesterase
MKSGFAELNGTRLYYEITGSGAPVVFIHGYTLDRRMWDEQTAVFAQKYQVIRYDLRGFGKSAVPNGERYAHYEDLKALLDYLGISQAAICGLSLGGSIAVNFGLAYPETTQSLILVDVSALEGFPWPNELSRWFDAIQAAATNGDMEQAKALWLGTDWFAPAHKKPAALTSLKRMVADYSGWDFVNDNPVRRLKPPAHERLEEISIPTLVIVGEEDLPFYNLPVADTLASRIPHAQKAIMPGVGHMSNMEDPQRFNEIVLSFLDSPP